jgi:hypothetical protein
MDKVRRIDRSNTAPSSKTFRYECKVLLWIRDGAQEAIAHVVILIRNDVVVPLIFVDVNMYLYICTTPRQEEVYLDVDKDKRLR